MPSENTLFFTMKFDVEDSMEQFEILSDNDVKIMFERIWTNKEVELYIETDDVAPMVVDYSGRKQNRSRQSMWSDDIEELYEPPPPPTH